MSTGWPSGELSWSLNGEEGKIDLLQDNKYYFSWYIKNTDIHDVYYQGFYRSTIQT